MRYDTIIIGGGLSGLICGQRLLEAGQNVAIISSGQSALHFNSGSMSLLGQLNGEDVMEPLKAMEQLDASHPYTKIGMPAVRQLLPQVKGIFAKAGITLEGNEERNHWRLTPVGMFKPAWLSFKDYATIDDPANISQWGKITAINIQGFVDFYSDFIANGLRKVGAECQLATISLPQLDRLRSNSTEMRATNIARVITGDVVDQLAAEIEKVAAGADTVLLPAVVGLFDETPVDELRNKLSCRLRYVTTMPMSVGGMRAQMRLRTQFQHSGGTYFIGDTVKSGKIDKDLLSGVSTINLGDSVLKADQFVLATGNFISHGLKATPTTISEPVFGLDVKVSASRSEWCNKDIYEQQNYMSFGVATDDTFHVYRNGKAISNFRAIGSVAGGHDPLKESSGGGVAILSALKVADDIINGK